MEKKTTLQKKTTTASNTVTNYKNIQFCTNRIKVNYVGPSINLPAESIDAIIFFPIFFLTNSIIYLCLNKLRKNVSGSS